MLTAIVLAQTGLQMPASRRSALWFDECIAVLWSFMDGRVRMDAAIRNVLDSDYDTLSYLDDANAVRDGEVRYPNDYQGEGRNFYLGVEARF